METCSKFCRACLTAAESFSYYIYENITPETYLFCTSIEVKCDDLPKSLCNCCYNLLKKFSEFKRTCIQSEDKLLGLSTKSQLEAGTGPYLKELNESRDQETAVCVEEESQENYCNSQSDADLYEDIDIFNKDTTCASPKKENYIKAKQKGLQQIKPKEKRKLNFQCGYCNKEYVLEKRFEAHKRTHERKPVPITCEPCNKTFASWNGLQTHMKASHSSWSFKDLTCKTCSKVSKTPQTLKTHYKTHEQREVIICDECGKGFKNNVTLKNHLETHMKNRERFTCQHCGTKYLSKTYLYKHIYHRHTDRRYTCNYCNYRFRDKNCLVKHILSHEGKQRLYKCDVCLRALTSQASLNVHRRIHTGERPFRCSNCPKRFTNKSMLVRHQRIHTGEKPFKCSVCEQSFKQSGSVRRHMKVHDRVRV